jgi:hypothetical protein
VKGAKNTIINRLIRPSKKAAEEMLKYGIRLEPKKKLRGKRVLFIKSAKRD